MVSATQVAQGVGTAVSIAGGIASTIGAAAPYVNLIAGWFPGLASVLGGIQIAADISAKVAASAPIVERAINAGLPIAQAIDTAGPEVMGHIKTLYAALTNADPSVPETAMKASDVSDAVALKFAGPALFGRPWTKEEEERWFDKASNPGGG